MIYNYKFANLVSLIYFVHPAYSIFGGLLIISMIYMKVKSIPYKWSPLILFSLLLYFVFINGIPFQNIRFHILIFPLFLILMFPAFQYGIEMFVKWRKFVLLTMLAVQLPLIYTAVSTPIMLSERESNITFEIRDFNDNNLFIYTSGMEGPISYYLTDSEYSGLYRESIKNFKTNFLLVIDSTRAMSQNPDSKLVRNLVRIYKEHSIVRRKTLEKNWIVYEFQR